MASVPDTAVAPPPEPPEEKRDDEFPRWPLWGPLAAVLAGAAVAFLVVGIVAAFLQSAGPKLSENSPWFTSLTSVGLDVGVVIASVIVAGRVAPPRPWQFGLRGAPFPAAVGTALLAIIGFFLFELVYSAALDPKNPQKIVEDLGADQNTALLVAGAVAVIVVAPIAEEFFFRGFLFRVLRLRMGFWLAAITDGVLFGLVHGSFVIVPILAVLGIALCWVYERTGSLFPCIAIHALNNTLAYGAGTDNGWPVAGALGGLMLTACIIVPRFLPGPSPTPAPI
jgi:membrane protease YdiL (CAAX protease family)